MPLEESTAQSLRDATNAFMEDKRNDAPDFDSAEDSTDGHDDDQSQRLAGDPDGDGSVGDEVNADADQFDPDSTESDESGDQESEQPEESSQLEVPKNEPVTPEFRVPPNDVLLTRAIRCGMTFAEVMSFPDEASLERVCTLIESGNAQGTKPEGSEKDPLEAFDNLDPDVYSESARELFGAMKEVITGLRKQVADLRQGQQYSAYVSEAAARQEIEQWFDGRIDALGESFHGKVGTGNYASLQEGSPQKAVRDAIANQVHVLHAGYQAIGMQPPPRDTLFQQAARTVLGDEFAKIEEGRIQEDLKRMSRQHIRRARGSGSRGQNEKGDPLDSVAAMLDEKYGSRAT